MTKQQLKEIQEKIGKWQAYNFPNSKIEEIALGPIEELGELCHLILKNKQGIRENPNYEREVRDAIGDTAIYCFSIMDLANFGFHTSNISMEEYENVFPVNDLPLVFLIHKLISDVGKLSNIFNTCFDLKSLNVIDVLKRNFSVLMNSIFLNLNNIAFHFNTTFEECLFETMEVVLKRDWIKFPKNGVTE